MIEKYSISDDDVIFCSKISKFYNIYSAKLYKNEYLKNKNEYLKNKNIYSTFIKYMSIIDTIYDMVNNSDIKGILEIKKSCITYNDAIEKKKK